MTISKSSIPVPKYIKINRENNATKNSPPASPSKPSIKLNAFVRLTTENIVKIPEKIPMEIIPKLEISPISTIERPEKITTIEAII